MEKIMITEKYYKYLKDKADKLGKLESKIRQHPKAYASLKKVLEIVK